VSKKSKGFIAPFAERDNFQGKQFQAPLIDVLEQKIRFSLKSCDTGKQYCISTVATDKNILADLYKRLGYFEDITWSTMRTLSRESGISIEKKDSANHKEMSSAFSEFDTFGHFRVSSKAKSTFRVFGAMRSDLFYILRFDVDGTMNHN
jgi:hypothetical protein